MFFPLSSHHEYQPPHPPHSPSPSPRSPITLSWQSTYTFRKCRDIQSSPGHAVGLLKAILLTQVHFHLSATLQKVGINKGEKRCTFTFNFVWMRNFSNSSLLAGEKGVNRLLSPTPSAHTHTHITSPEPRHGSLPRTYKCKRNAPGLPYFTPPRPLCVFVDRRGLIHSR